MIRIFTILLIIFTLNCNKGKNKNITFINTCNECEVIELFYPNGEINWKISKLNGKKHGKSIGWWPNGVIQAEKFYKNGKRHGPQKIWSDMGNLMKETFWIEGVRQ